MDKIFTERLEYLKKNHEALLTQKNEPLEGGNGIIKRFRHPVLTAAHVPINWCYDLNETTNPYLMERFGVNTVFNAGAIKWNNKYILMPRVESVDRKSFFAIAESDNGIDNFKFWDEPVVIPETDEPDTNVYDMRLVAHEDGWVYGFFCTERKDPAALPGDQSSAIAQCGIVRSKDLKKWERLPDLKTKSAQQRNVVLHPEFVNGNYAFYTRPQDSFIEAGQGGGIAFGLSDKIVGAEVNEETVIDQKTYHTINELKNGQGPAPIKTKYGWLHLAHGVRNTAAGLRYVLYMFMTDLKDLAKITYKPAGYFIAPEGDERVGDVSNVVFSNGWIVDDDGKVFIYYASSDSRVHVAVSTVDQLLDYTMNTPSDGLRSAATVQRLMRMINANKAYVREEKFQAANSN
jgi:4-O-beta-D-mannosyl-D-glucose phosphorylase